MKPLHLMGIATDPAPRSGSTDEIWAIPGLHLLGLTTAVALECKSMEYRNCAYNTPMIRDARHRFNRKSQSRSVRQANESIVYRRRPRRGFPLKGNIFSKG